MKKAQHDQKEVFLSEKNGEIHLWNYSSDIDEILAAVNRGLKGDWGETTLEAITLRELYEWICRYIEEGATEELLNDLNADLHHMHYYRYVVPPDFFPSGDGDPQCLYVTNLNYDYVPETVAASEFSKLITSGMISKLKRCQLHDCDNIFIGPPQAKWCSKSCGSKYRVRKQRKRNSS